MLPLSTARRTGIFFVLCMFFSHTVGVASAQSTSPFSDLPTTHPSYSAVSFLYELGIMRGYEDGTFQPKKKLTRAEALKVIMLSAGMADEPASGTQQYDDVPVDSWFFPYVERARTQSIIDSPSKNKTFRGADVVSRAAFLKMLLLAHGEQPLSSYAEITDPLAVDVQDASAWYYPFFRYALAASMTMIRPDGKLAPEEQLSREQAALFIHRLLMYKEGRRTQALLSAAEADLVNTLSLFEAQNFEQANQASVRALLAARGAHAKKQDVPLVQGAVKVTEAFRSLMRGYAAGVEQRYEEAIALAKEAWGKANDAKARSASLSDLSAQLQKLAQTVAEAARSKQQ